MERLTIRDSRGRAYFDNDGILICGANGTFHQKKDMTAQYIHDRFVALDKVIDRLAAYEDTVPLERAQELAKAEKDGRLVVLPDVKYTDADGEKALRRAMWICGNTNNPVTRYAADAIAEKLCREAKEDNPPLTPEELLELDGEPVWNDNAKKWIVVDLEWYTGKLGIGHEGDYMDLTNRYYRRRPEEVDVQ